MTSEDERTPERLRLDRVRSESVCAIPTFRVRTNDSANHAAAIDGSTCSDEFRKAYEAYQAVRLTGFSSSCNRSASVGAATSDHTTHTPNSHNRPAFTVSDIAALYDALDEADKSSWCVETQRADSTKVKQRAPKRQKRNGSSELTPSNFLGNVSSQEWTSQDNTVGYCSFLVQKDKDAYERLLHNLPLSSLPFAADLQYEPCIWIFFGRNFADGTHLPDMQGRSEHTDSISHDGTWHYQLSGVKRWMLRPTPKLLEYMSQRLSQSEMKQWNERYQSPSTASSSPGPTATEPSPERIKVECNHGDVIVINTKLWYHQTVIPHQRTCSVSYARDFWLPGRLPVDGTVMSNVDGMYATDDIEAGTVIFTESDMPDGELHRSKNANCEVVELEDGTNAVVSSKPIAAGDFFCVPDSSSDEEDSDCHSWHSSHCHNGGCGDSD